MLALTIKQPWTYAILNLGKDIENRDWFTSFRGTIAVHASKKLDVAEFDSFYLAMKNKFDASVFWNISELWDSGKIGNGVILGTVDITNCVKRSDSIWFQGDYGFVLKNPVKLFEPIPCRGYQMFWEVPKEIEAQIREQM